MIYICTYLLSNKKSYLVKYKCLKNILSFSLISPHLFLYFVAKKGIIDPLVEKYLTFNWREMPSLCICTHLKDTFATVG